MRTFLLLALILSVIEVFAQPYGGTIFVDPDIITASDSSAYETVTYLGRGSRLIFDRRVNSWVTVDAYLFEVSWNDDLRSEAVINPEFGTVELAQLEAEKYGRHIGQLPACLRRDVHQIWVNKGVQLFGGGNNSILIHTGQTAIYEKDGILEETLVHEAAHTSLDAMHAGASGWIEAQNLDGGFISDYAEEYPFREDIAESFLLWMAVRYREDRMSQEDIGKITQAIPNRLRYFDGIGCDLFPFYIERTTAAYGPVHNGPDIIVFPNPAADFVQLRLDDLTDYRAVIYNAGGQPMLREHLIGHGRIDIAQWPAGLYILVLQGKGEWTRTTFLKR